MVYLVYHNIVTTKFIHHKSNVVVLNSLKFTFQIVIFYISDSRPLADFFLKLFYNYLSYRPTAYKNRQQVFFYDE